MLLTQPQLLNSYSYARNNPISYVDPSGAVPVPIALGGLGAAFGFGVEAGAQIQSGQINPMALFEATLLGATVGLGLGVTFELGLATLGLVLLIPGGATAVLDAFAVAVILGVASGMSGVEIEKLLRDLGASEDEIDKLRDEFEDAPQPESEPATQPQPPQPSSSSRSPSPGLSGGGGFPGGNGFSPTTPIYISPAPAPTPRITITCLTPIC